MVKSSVFKTAMNTVLCILAWQTMSYAQGGSLKFHYLTVENGLSKNWIRAIQRDHQGFMWFASENGLNRLNCP